MKNHFLECDFWPVERDDRDAEPAAGGVNAATVRHLLVIFFCGIGDLVVFIPALEELGRFFAGAKLSVMAPPPAGDTVLHHPRIHEVHSLDALDRKNFFRRFDFIINLSGKDERINALLRAADVRHLIIKDRLFDRRGQHASDYHLHLVRQIESRFFKPLVYLTAAERRASAHYLAGLGLDPARDLIAAVHPGSGDPRKNWDWRRFRKVCQALARDEGAAVLLLSGPDEHDLCLKIGAKLPGRVVVVQEPLRLVAALLEQCALVVCNDSGVMHLAAAVGTPVVGLFNASVSLPETWGPISGRHSIICKESHAAITVAEVMQSARVLLRRG